MADVTVAHEVDEDPEELTGRIIKDPWADDSVEDWPEVVLVESEEEPTGE